MKAWMDLVITLHEAKPSFMLTASVSNGPENPLKWSDTFDNTPYGRDLMADTIVSVLEAFQERTTQENEPTADRELT